MTTVDSVIVIAGMFLVTFGIRFVLFARAHKVSMPEWLEKALRYVPVAVLTAIITPMIVMPNQQLNVALNNPWLLGAAAAFLVGIWRQQQLLTIVVGVLVFFISKYLVGL
ncbi:AzlD domain-containing protein [Marinomonas transparens]|uniref:AzlD domain-containing protein n=1 Tax=Marinomonas transparens TaxID=2795388 RepID=A0A934N1G3_9GAMM|nr:AzlD domain-containing protein [Marinomonas transparens]MBJ7539485.1 AzlD domain-containing protein [Marinomonas transparens]